MYQDTTDKKSGTEIEFGMDEIEEVGGRERQSRRKKETVDNYDYEQLYEENRDNILGMFIERYLNKDYLSGEQKKALYYGTKALLDSMEGRL